MIRYSEVIQWFTIWRIVQVCKNIQRLFNGFQKQKAFVLKLVFIHEKLHV